MIGWFYKFGEIQLNNLDNHISMEEVNSLALKMSDMAELDTNLTMDESDSLFCKLVNLLEKFYQFPDYNNYN